MHKSDPADGSEDLFTLAEPAVELRRIADALFDHVDKTPDHLASVLDDLQASDVVPGSCNIDAEAAQE